MRDHQWHHTWQALAVNSRCVRKEGLVTEQDASRQSLFKSRIPLLFRTFLMRIFIKEIFLLQEMWKI